MYRIGVSCIFVALLLQVLHTADAKRAQRQLFNRRLGPRRLFKAHGRWCGPTWTDGRRISAKEYMNRGGDFKGVCIDKADCACRQHDYDCAIHNGCCKEDDTKLIRALKGTGSPWISGAMRVARLCILLMVPCFLLFVCWHFV